MKKRLLWLSVIACALSAPALADHNSKWGEGWANMPNDIHNTRIDTRGDNNAFRDFVRRGNGADSVNRYDTSVRSQSPAAQPGRMTGHGQRSQARQPGGRAGR